MDVDHFFAASLAWDAARAPSKFQKTRCSTSGVLMCSKGGVSEPNFTCLPTVQTPPSCPTQVPAGPLDLWGVSLRLFS